MGVKSLAKATEHHTMVRVRPKNHFNRLMFLYVPLNFREHIIMNTGMRKALMPKQRLMKKWET